jgi:hypothetical protein
MRKVNLFIFLSFFFVLIASISFQAESNSYKFSEWLTNWSYQERMVNTTYYNELKQEALDNISDNPRLRLTYLICYPIALIFVFLSFAYRRELEESSFIAKVLSFSPKKWIKERKEKEYIESQQSLKANPDNELNGGGTK